MQLHSTDRVNTQTQRYKTAVSGRSMCAFIIHWLITITAMLHMVHLHLCGSTLSPAHQGRGTSSQSSSTRSSFWHRKSTQSIADSWNNWLQIYLSLRLMKLNRFYDYKFPCQAFWPQANPSKLNPSIQIALRKYIYLYICRGDICIWIGF